MAEASEPDRVGGGERGRARGGRGEGGARRGEARTAALGVGRAKTGKADLKKRERGESAFRRYESRLGAAPALLLCVSVRLSLLRGELLFAV